MVMYVGNLVAEGYVVVHDRNYEPPDLERNKRVSEHKARIKNRKKHDKVKAKLGNKELNRQREERRKRQRAQMLITGVQNKGS